MPKKKTQETTENLQLADAATQSTAKTKTAKSKKTKEAKKVASSAETKATKNTKPASSIKAAASKDAQPEKKKLFSFGKKQEPEVVPKRVKRVKADYKTGLTSDQVQERINKNQTNFTPNQNVKTYRSIFIENIFTFLNVLCFAIAISLMCVGAFSDCLGIVIILVNITIGIVQEIRAKLTIEKLSLLTAPAVKVVRDGVEITISTNEVVIDDIILLSTGKQIVADSVIIEGNIEVNESMLTGESQAIKKKVGDTVLAGSFVVSGHAYVRAEKVGKANYIQQLAAKAKKYKRPKSELFSSLNNIIRVIGFIIIPVGILMYVNNFIRSDGSITATITNTAGSLMGMIPSGMFLLCSVSLSLSVIKLSRKKALVQDLYCVEMLARVNTLCLDKTGTITDGTMKVYNCLQLNDTEFTLKRIMGSMLSALGDNNQTSQALINYFGYNKELKAVETLPFSSARKLSAVTFESGGTYVMGAPEFVIPNNKDEKLESMIEQYSKDGYRVMLLAHTDGTISKDNITGTRKPVALLILEDRIRDDAVETIKWFKNNGVNIKIISGDNPLTVAEIAKRVGVTGTQNLISLEGLNEKQVIAAANKYTVFGRVTPEQKAILVKALKATGNTVAMTGDGVNDILALKEADCSIAMASGNEAVRSVSHMVLLDSNFSSMPATVIEGRRVINNMQKASALFFMKTLFTIFLSVMVLILGFSYPLRTINMLMLEMFVIGIPSFFLAFLPNDTPVKGRFLLNLVKNALPGALSFIFNTIAVYVFCLAVDGTVVSDAIAPVITTMLTLTITFTGLTMLIRLCKPFNTFKTVLCIAMYVICLVLIIAMPAFFGLAAIDLAHSLFVVILILLSPTLINAMFAITEKIKFKD
ncbi:MAG: HAD-IC family P-type ATPase [Clostridia bacterium]|nr:HAD-IC family P-type ATPase [Clostridia bacterium]